MLQKKRQDTRTMLLLLLLLHKVCEPLFRKGRKAWQTKKESVFLSLARINLNKKLQDGRESVCGHGGSGQEIA